MPHEYEYEYNENSVRKPPWMSVRGRVALYDRGPSQEPADAGPSKQQADRWAVLKEAGYAEFDWAAAQSTERHRRAERVAATKQAARTKREQTAAARKRARRAARFDTVRLPAHVRKPKRSQTAAARKRVVKAKRGRAVRPPTPETRRVALYARGASPDNTNTLDWQLQMMNDQVALLPGWVVVDTFRETGSGSRINPELEAALSAVESGSYDVLMVSSLDRLARSPEILHAILERLHRGNARVASAREGLGFGNDPHAQFVTNLLSGLARFEQETLHDLRTTGEPHGA